MKQFTESSMKKQIQRFWGHWASITLRATSPCVARCTRLISSIKLYVHPTLSQRLGVVSRYHWEFAYQKANSRFDNYPIRAIIRDEYNLNGHQSRPQWHPF